MEPATAETLDTKEQLLRAGEHLFAREGIHRVKLREINAMAILGRHNVLDRAQFEAHMLEAALGAPSTVEGT